MANLRGPIARGEKSGAFALGFSDKMKSVAGAMAVLALATTGTVVVQAQTAPAALAQETDSAAPAADSADQIIDADMIASGRVTKAANLTDAHGVGKGLISGHVYMATPGGNPGAAYDNGNVKLDGVTVYAQFRDKDGSYSPIFSAKTHTLPDVVGSNGGHGTFAFGTGEKGITWTDKLGVEHTWSARTDQKHRIWVEPFTNDRGNRVEMFRQANGFVPGSFNHVSQYPLGSFVAADGNMQLMAAFLQELAPNHENSYMVAKDENGANKIEHDANGYVAGQNPWNSVSGKVWAEVGKTDAGIVASGPSYTGTDGDVTLEGYKVFASTLTPEGAAQNEILHQRFKDDPGKLAEETKKMLEDHPEYILKTVSGETDKDGNYTLRFNDGQTADEQSRDRLNLDHMYLWVEDKNGVVQQGYTGFHTPIFQRFSDGGNFRPQTLPAPNVVTSTISRNRVYNVNYGVMPYTPVSITADYNATDKPAAPGTKVTPEFSGDLSTLPSKVEWRDQKGNVLKTCELDQSQGIKAQVAACTFDIPEDAKKGDYFNVVLVSGGNDVSAWTVLVTKDADEFAPSYEDKLVVPGKETKSSPTFNKVDEEGNPTEETVEAPEGSKFTIPEDFKAPEGYEVKIDENTGEITVTFPDKSKLNKDTVEEFDVPVTVTYPDGSTDKTDANFKLDTDGDGEPDVTDTDDDGDGIPDEDDSNPKVPNQNTIFEPGYEDGSGKPGSDVKIDAPKFTDKDGNDTKAPEGTTFTPGDNVPDGVTIDENTGEITVTIPEDATPGEKITVPVEVTYPDGTKDNVDVTVTVTDKDNGVFEPGYEDGSGKPGDDVKIDKPVFKDKDGNPAEAPEGTTFGPGENTPDGVTIDENTGEITVTIPEDANPGDKITVPVEVTYPDGSKDNVDVTITVDEPEQPEAKDNEKYEPEYDGGTGQPGDDVKIDKPTFKDGDNNEVEVPSGTTFTPGENAPEGVTVNEDGSIDVTIPEDATPGDKITVPVVVTYPDGTKDNVEVTVTVTAKDATPVTPVAPTETNPSSGASADDPASCELPPYVTVTETEGVEYKVTVDGKELTPDAEGKYVYEYGQTVKVEATPAAGYTFPDGATTTWTWTTKQNEVCEAPETKDNENFEPGYEDGSGKPGDDVTVDKPVFKDNNGEETTPPEGTKFEKGEGAPENVTVNEDGSITVKVPEDADPGDKITVPVVVTYPDGSTDEVEVTVTVEQPDAPAEKPDWKDDKGKPGDKVEIPNDGGPVPGDTTVETEGPGKAEIDEDGKLIVDIDKDAKPGDKVVVIVKDKDDNEIDRVVVEVEQPDAPAEDPKWEDTTTTPDKPVEIPNTGGDVPEGTTVETEGPGKAEIDENGTITVTPDKDAKPGDKIKVVVKDKDDKVIDEVTVTITEKPKPGGSSDLPEGLIPGLIGGGIIGGIIGGNLGSSHGSSTPGHGAGSGQGADKGAGQGADKGADNQGGKGAGQSGTSQSGAAQSGASSSSADRQGSLAVTGVSGVAIMLGAAAMALAIGGALLAGRRRREN